MQIILLNKEIKNNKKIMKMKDRNIFENKNRYLD